MIFYTPYIPMYRHADPDHRIEERPALLTEEHRDKMLIVLDRHNEKYRLRDGQLLIKRSLMRNVDLVSNYTMQALQEQKTD